MHVLLAALALIAPATERDVGHGLALRVPPGWHLLDRRLTPCVNPIERVDVAGPGGSLLMLQEALDRKYVDRFPRRSRRFRVRGHAEFLVCCGARSYGKGWMLPFRDGGRSFYAYVYPGGGSPRPLLAILDSLRVTPPR
jgi:hypothetical protein